MQLSVQLISATGEASASGMQVINAINSLVGDIAETKSAFDNIDRLVLGLVLSHPMAAHAPGPATARYHAPTKTVFGSASVIYEKWLDENWSSRVEAAGEALVATVGAVAKSRLTAEERTTVLDIIREGTELAKASRPDAIAALGSVYLTFHPGSDKPAVGFGDSGSTSTGADVLEVKPSGLLAYLKSNPQEAPTPPSMFKLYIRRDGRLDYHEAWIGDGEIIEHWGKCGERGETRSHPINPGADSFALLGSLSREPMAAGFKSIPLSRHTGLIVERQVEDFGSPDDLERRHELEQFLDGKLGWLGLGHCDGGSIGSGSMEAYCLVVDGALALDVLRRELAASAFSDFHTRLAPQGG